MADGDRAVVMRAAHLTARVTPLACACHAGRPLVACGEHMGEGKKTLLC